MKVLYNWLREFVPLEISPKETADTLERLGFEVSGLRLYGEGISNVVVAEVRAVGKHPNADRLSLCKVWDGQTEFSVVCGAANVRAGIRVPFARLGATLPGGVVIKPTKIRSVESQGMICSAEELGLEDASEGILILENTAPLGEDVRQTLSMDDALIEIEVTPNRRDALGVIGIARELAAGLALPLKSPEPRFRELDMTHPITVQNEATDLCPRYIARLVRDLRIGPSPAWMVQRLTRCGIRSINNIVDITNYVLLELGQPLHAFDAVKMKGRQVRIRRSKTDESLLLLDGKTVKLPEGLLVIADEARPAALAGIMGGQESAISEHTQELILESAAFAPGHIRANSKLLDTRSESSYRFERGSDWDMVSLASRRATQLIQELAGGLAFKPVESTVTPPASIVIKLRTERVREFLDIDTKESVIADTFRRLGCIINTGTGQLAVTVPSWRLDLTMEADLMEELARLHGYDQIPQRSPAFKPTSVSEDPLWSFERRLASRLASLGFSETFNYSFLSQVQVAPYVPGLGQPADAVPIAIANPLSQEQAVLRTCLLPGLLQNALLNFHHQASGARLFEISRVFYQDQTGKHEVRRAALLLAGEIAPAQWRAKPKKADFHDMSGTLEAFLQMLHMPNVQFSVLKSPLFHPKRSCTLLSGNTVLGWFGEIHPLLQEQLDTREPLVMAELDVAALHRALPGTTTYVPMSMFPPVLRDVSFITPLATPYEKIAKTLRASGGALLESISLIDLYQGDKIGEDRKSMTVSLTFRNKDKTLVDADVEKVMQRIVVDLEKKCEATLRK